MYKQTFSFNTAHMVKIKKLVASLFDQFENTKFKIYKTEGRTPELLVTSSVADEFNQADKIITREIQNFNNELSDYRNKRRLEKDKQKKRDMSKAASNIEKNIREYEQKKNEVKKVDYQYYYNGGESTNPKNFYFGLEPDVMCP
jgi:hypothetical protein